VISGFLALTRQKSSKSVAPIKGRPQHWCQKWDRREIRQGTAKTCKEILLYTGQARQPGTEESTDGNQARASKQSSHIHTTQYHLQARAKQGSQAARTRPRPTTNEGSALTTSQLTTPADLRRAADLLRAAEGLQRQHANFYPVSVEI